MLDFISPGHSCDSFGNIRRYIRAGSADGEPRERLPSQGTDKLDVETDVPVAGDFHIACPDRSERFEGGGHLGNDVGIGISGGNHDVPGFVTVAESEGTQGVGLDAEFVNGVFDGLGTWVGRNFDAHVDFDLQGVGLKDQPVNPGKGCPANRGVERGKLTGRVFAVGHEDQGKGHVGSIEPEGFGSAAVQADKCGHLGRSDAEVVDFDFLTVGKCHCFQRFHKSKVSADLEEVE